MSDLAMYDAVDSLERASDPGEFVMVALERGKTWLTEALNHGDLDALVTMKGWAATLRTATMQKQLGKDAELAATELVRRAERCIGLGIREGQKVGAIADKAVAAQERWSRDSSDDFVPAPRATDYATPVELYGNGATAVGILAFTDDVTDEAFDAAIDEAKDEGNLSRANLVRKVKPERKPKPADRHEIHHRAPRVDAERIIEQTIATLDGLASGLALIEDVQSLDAEKRLEWLNALSQPLAAINRFKKELSR